MKQPNEKLTHNNWIVHLCRSEDWRAALDKGCYQADSLAEVGFIHCSRPEQVVGVANRYYQGRTDLLLLWIDPNQLQAELRWEAADNDTFPHLYGALNLEAVRAVEGFPLDSDGYFHIQPEPPL